MVTSGCVTCNRLLRGVVDITRSVRLVYVCGSQDMRCFGGGGKRGEDPGVGGGVGKKGAARELETAA